MTVITLIDADARPGGTAATVSCRQRGWDATPSSGSLNDERLLLSRRPGGLQIAPAVFFIAPDYNPRKRPASARLMQRMASVVNEPFTARKVLLIFLTALEQGLHGINGHQVVMLEQSTYHNDSQYCRCFQPT